GRPVPIRFDAPCLVVAGPTLIGLLALGVLAALAVKVAAVRLVCLAAAVAVVAASALPATVYFGEQALTVVAGVMFALAVALLAVAVRAPTAGPVAVVRAPAHVGAPVDRQPQSGLGLSLAAVGLALVAGLVQVAIHEGPLDRIGTATAVVIGAA